MKKFFISLCLCSLVFMACAFNNAELSILTYDSYDINEDLVADFESQNGVKLQFIQAGSGSATLSKAILTKDAPIADVILGIEGSLLPRALDADILEPYESAQLKHIDNKFNQSPSAQALPFNYGDVCLNYDTAWFEEKGIAAPASLEDLLNPQLKGALVVENPESSNPGMAFLMLTINAYGEDGFVDYWKKLVENGVEITNDWTAAYYTNFSGSSGKGAQPLVVSYASSPAAEMIYAETPLEKAPTASIVADGMCYRQIEYAGILKGTKNLDLAQKFLDALIGKAWQEDMPMQMFVYPVNSEAILPEDFLKYGQTAENPVILDAKLVSENRDEWVKIWVDEVLKQY